MLQKSKNYVRRIRIIVKRLFSAALAALLLLFAGQILRNMLQLCVCRQYLLLKVIRTVSGNRTAAVLRTHVMELHNVLRYIKRHTQLFRLIAFIGQGITAQHAKA